MQVQEQAMNPFQRFLLALLAIALPALGAAPRRQGASQSSQNRPTHVIAPAAEIRNENRIAQEVRHRLLMLPYYSVFDSLSYVVQGSTVVLDGKVVNPANKSDAAAAVKNIEGVDKVVNHIEILPPSPMDAQIRRAEYRAIYGFDGLSIYGFQTIPSIHIIVENGRVRLEGVVDNKKDKDLAGLRAKGVPNVFSVDNELVVANNSGK
jgi:hyperosmotically inducible protein